MLTQTQPSSAESIGSSAAATSSNLVLTGGRAPSANYVLNGCYSFTPALTLSGAYAFTDASLDGASPKYPRFTLQSDYALSRHTDVYVEATYQHVRSTQSKARKSRLSDSGGLCLHGHSIPATRH